MKTNLKYRYVLIREAVLWIARALTYILFACIELILAILPGRLHWLIELYRACKYKLFNVVNDYITEALIKTVDMRWRIEDEVVKKYVSY